MRKVTWQGNKKAIDLLHTLMREHAETWELTYAAIYKAGCDVCGKHDYGVFYILNGSHDNGSHCESCHKKRDTHSKFSGDVK